MAHTPGPWINGTTVGLHISRRGYYSFSLETRPPGGIWIADVLFTTTNPKDMAEANARLIITAPELLEAAEAIVLAINESGEWADRGGWLANLEAAIRKARGG